MRIADLKGKKIVIWGAGREGQAARAFIRAHLPDANLVMVDEAGGKDVSADIAEADIIVKSPGVSLYHPLLSGKTVTSLMNLWFGKKPAAKTVCITGTKGKSTTTALLTHALNKLGCKAAAVGNIGVPISEAPADMDVIVIETSSYQAANFDGIADIAAITSLYGEHLDWHRSEAVYHRDKLRLLDHAKKSIVHAQVSEVVTLPDGTVIVGDEAGDIPNTYLARAHNRANVGVAMALIKALGFEHSKALAALADFKGLPHRQQELGEKDGVLYVDDSIATTPQAAIAALDVYRDRNVTLIAGGFDRGVDYGSLAAYIREHGIAHVIAMGASGERLLKDVPGTHVTDMAQAVARARTVTPKGGVILLSPAAPSFGMFTNYIERGQAFAKESGF